MKTSQSKPAKLWRKFKKPKQGDDPAVELMLSMRGRMVKWSGDGQGYGTPYEHYWIIVSRNEIGFEPKAASGRWRSPLLVVPINKYEPGVTQVGPSDIVIEDESKIPFPFPGGRPTVIRCGYLRAYNRRNKDVSFYQGRGASEKLMDEIDKKLVEVLGLEDYVERLVAERQTNRA